MTSDTEQRDTLHVGPGPGLDRRLVVVVVAVVVAMLAALGIAGYAYLNAAPDPTPTTAPTAAPTAGPSASPSRTPGQPLVLPAEFGAYQRDERSQVETPVSPEDDLTTATAYYERNGVRELLVVGAEPVFDLELFLLSIGLSEITAHGDGFCGEYSGVQLCAVNVDQLAVAVAGLDEQSPDQLVKLAREARAAF